MWKYVLYVLVFAAIIGLVGGGIHLYRVSQKNKKEMAQYGGEDIAVNKKLGKVLVVYYSLSGHTKDIAERLQNKTGADLYEIKTAEEIKANPLFYAKVKQQLKNGDYPKLAGEMPDFAKYDLVFVGSPVWWYTVSTPVLSFLQDADFKGKKVVPFSTQGSNYGTFFEDFAHQAKNAEIMPSENFNNLPEKYDVQVDNKIAQWLNKL